MLKVNRIVFLAEPSNVRLQPHTGDSSKFVLKSAHPECAAELCKALGVKPGKQWRGSVHFITEVDKVEFMEGFSKLALAAAQAPQPKALPEKGTCSECGGTDGTHWGFCMQHMENKAVN